MIIKDGLKRHKDDFYETPAKLAEFALRYLVALTTIKTDVSILDTGAGMGVWGTAWRNMFPAVRTTLTGIDLPGTSTERSVDTSVYNTWVEHDYRAWDTTEKFNLVIGNPPFYLAEEFVHLSLNHLLPFGWLVYLLPLRFLSSQGRTESLYRNRRPWCVLNIGARVSFSGDGKTDDTDYAIFYWQKGNYPYWSRMDWVNWQKDPLPTTQQEVLQATSTKSTLAGALDSWTTTTLFGDLNV